MVEAPRLFTKKQCEPVTTHAARDLESSFEESPETFDTVGVHIAPDIYTALVVDLFVREEVEDVRISAPSVGVDERAWLCMRTQERNQRDAFEIGNGRSDDLSRCTAQHAEDGLFARSMTAFGTLPADAPRLVSPLTANECLIDFHCSCKWCWNIFCHEDTQVVQHSLYAVTFDTSRFCNSHICAITQKLSYNFFPLLAGCRESFDTSPR